MEVISKVARIAVRRSLDRLVAFARGRVVRTIRESMVCLRTRANLGIGYDMDGVGPKRKYVAAPFFERRPSRLINFLALVRGFGFEGCCCEIR